jgi:hypothetical protein
MNELRAGQLRMWIDDDEGWRGKLILVTEIKSMDEHDPRQCGVSYVFEGRSYTDHPNVILESTLLLNG